MQKKEFILSIANGAILGLVTYFQITIFPTLVDEWQSLFGLPLLLLFLEFLVLKFIAKKKQSLIFYVIGYVIAILSVMFIFIFLLHESPPSGL